MATPASADDYLAGIPGTARAVLQDLRRTILDAVPEPTETISYQMPSVRSGGRIVVWYAAFKDHLSIFPASEKVREALGAELEPFLSGKGTIRFTVEEPIPPDLVRRIVEIRLQENAHPSSAP